MTDAERREAARQFINRWQGKGKEDEDDRSFWIEFFEEILGVSDATKRMEYQKKVLNAKGMLSNRIDFYIPETKVIIEQKSFGIPLDKPQANHGGKTPYEQAKEYDNALPYEEKCRWIITSNFSEIWIYNMSERKPEPVKFALTDLRDKYSAFDFLINQKTKKISQEVEVSVKAGEFVGLLYDALLDRYKDPTNPESLKSLNMLCVRLVFCLYAEDAHVFGSNGSMFHDYLEQFETKDMRRALIDLFKVLDQDPDKNERDAYLDEDLAAFPYVNGGLFADENIEIPQFTDEIREILLVKASEGFDWSQISPTIFGAVFESTLNTKTRRSGGMHYTSIENIHKVIDPLFLNDLNEEFENINSIDVVRNKKPKLERFQDKLASLTWFDPACGSGNFLTETYMSIRRLENRVIRAILDCDKKQISGQIVIGEAINPIKVGINQFYGIEINDFAVTVAKTALWIAESQMMKETEDMIHMSLDFLPLKTNANIHEGNSLRMDWNEIIPSKDLSYLMGNPPFVGYSLQTKEQKADITSIYVDEEGKPYKTAGKIDYVAGWYFKASEYIQKTAVKVAFVSTNSITQGEQVASVWAPLFERFNISIFFAHRTFQWDSEASIKAHVHCVIVGFSTTTITDKYIYEGSQRKKATNISPYLVDADNIFIQTRKDPLCDVPKMITGNRPADGGALLIEEDEYNNFITNEPSSIKYIKKLLGAEEFIKSKDRWCLWLVGADPAELKKMPMVMKRIELCRKNRLEAKDAGRRKLADTPTLFRETNNPSSYIAIPEISSEKRRYIPMDFLDDSTICTNRLKIIPDASLYEFGILVSNVHMAWTRAVCGRLETRYCYSKDVVYNNFPWPNPTAEQRKKIEATAQAILDSRKLYKNSTLDDLYGEEMYLYSELQKTHDRNNAAVMEAYGFSIKDTSETTCVSQLMAMYEKLTSI